MDLKQMPKIAVMVAVAVVVLSTVCVPAISNAMEVNGDPIVKTNNGTGRTFKEMVPGDVLKCVSSYNDGSRTDVWTLNDETVLNEGITDLTWDWFLVTDVFYGQAFAPSNSSVGAVTDIVANPGALLYLGGAVESNNLRTHIFEMDSDKKIQYTYLQGDTVTTTKEYTPTWAYVISSVEDGAYMSAQLTTNPYYARYGNKEVILAGTYTTGEFDTGYYYGKDGVLTVVNDSYTGVVNFTQELSDGTTDIYDTTITVTISDGTDSEEFSPYRALVPYEVQGHATSGSLYTVLGVVPIFIALAILVGIVGFVYIRFRY